MNIFATKSRGSSRLFRLLFIGGVIFLAAVSGRSQTTGYLLNGAGIGPITYGRNITVTTTNDSTAFTVSKPAPTNGLTNDFLDFFSGSTPVFSVAPNGALTNLGSNAIQQTQASLGVQAFSNPATNSTAYTNTFAPPFHVAPAIIMSHNGNVIAFTPWPSATNTYV
jgi:hypothetical protein